MQSQVQPQNPQMMTPQQMMQAQPTYTLPNLIGGLTEVFIKQKADILEAFTPCEVPNRYYVHQSGGGGENLGPKILKFKETTGCFQRQCAPPDCRAIAMDGENLFNQSQQCLVLDRKCSVAFYCLNRPTMTVDYVEGGQSQYLGKIIDNWDCCNFSFSVMDENDTKIFHIEASCMQLGFHCKLPFEACEKIDFKIFKVKEGEKEECPFELKKKSPGCMKSAFSDADNFSLPFPDGATWQQKSLLMAATLMIDYRLFEEKGSGNPAGG